MTAMATTKRTTVPLVLHTHVPARWSPDHMLEPEPVSRRSGQRSQAIVVISDGVTP